jgi:hypothetical protein
LLIAAGILIGLPVMNMGSAMAGRVCGPPECYTAECWWIGPGHRRCRRVCRRRCYWQPEPRYEPPIYEAPVYAPPVYADTAPAYTPPSYANGASPPFPAEALIGIGLLAIVITAAVAAIAASGGATEAVSRDADETRALTEKLEAAAREADEHIAAFLDRERRRGGDDHG